MNRVCVRVLMGSAVLSLIVLFGLSTQAVAAEQIERFDSLIEVQADGSIEVTEVIRVRAEGSQVRRGIYRDFPTRYRDRYGNRVVVDFEMIEVLRDGQTEPWFTQHVSNGIRINTGDDSFLQVPATIQYTIRYRTTRQLGFFDQHDELYWNVTGNGWELTIQSASAEVRLPQAVPSEQMKVAAYTGPFGSQGQNARAEIVGPGNTRFETTQALAAGDGLTIVTEWPKGMIVEPSLTQRIGWLLKDNRSVLIMLIGLALILLYYVKQWHKKGRDPKPGVIIARYDPPEGYSPAGLRYMLKRHYDSRCFAADLVDLGVKGKIRILRQDKGIKKEEWTVERIDTSAASPLPVSQSTVMQGLFKKDSQVKFEAENAALLMATRNAQARALFKRYRPDYLIGNWKVIAIGFPASIALFMLAIIIGQGSAVGLTMATGAVLLLINFIFVWLIQTVTQRGRKLLDHIQGLRLYLDVAEQQDLARLEHRNPDEPKLDAARFEALLPFALALDVEQGWTKKFEAAAGVAAATAAAGGMAWYSASGGRTASLSDLGNSLGKSFTSQISSASSPPGSSSGGGGGGSSGGGGGGGGGGGR